MMNWAAIHQLFWRGLISQMWLGRVEDPSEDRLEHGAHLREFAEWLTEFVSADLEKRRFIPREIEDLMLDTLHYLHDPDERMRASARVLVERLLEPIFARGLLNEIDPVFRRLIGYVIGLDPKLTRIFGVRGPTEEFFDRVPQEEVELQACEILNQFFSGQQPGKLRYLLPFHVGILLERVIDGSSARTSDGQPLHLPIPEDVPLLFLPLTANPPLRRRLFEHFRTCFEEVEPPLARLIEELFPNLTADDPILSQKSLRNFYCAYLLSTHFQLTRDPVRGTEYLANLPLAELDALCGAMPVWSQGVNFPELIKTQIQEAQAVSKEPSQAQKSSILPILAGPSELALAFAGFSEELLQRYPEDQRLDVLSHWAEMAETGINLFDSLRWLGALLRVAYCFPALKVVSGGKEKLLREWLTDHLLKVLRYKPQKPVLSTATEKNLVLDIEFFRRVIHAKILRLALQVVASPVHLQALSEERDQQLRDVVGELLVKGIILTHRILLILLHHTHLPLDQIDRRLAEAMSPDVSPWGTPSLRDQFNPELYGPESDKYDHLLSGTLAVFRVVGLGGSGEESGLEASSSAPFWLTSPVRRELMAMAKRPENDAERQVREAREQAVPNRLQTFLNRTPQEYAAELLRFASPDYTRGEQILLRGQARLLELLRQASDALSVEMAPPPPGADQPDMTLKVQIGSGDARHILISAQTSAEPRHLRQAIIQLQGSMGQFSAAYGLIVTPAIAERGRKLCENQGIGYLDLQGNSFIKFAGVFIKTVVSRKETRKPGRPKSLFAPVSTRVVRVLLAEPRRHWKLKELAAVTHMSLGQVYKVKQELLNQEFIEADKKKQLSLKDVTGLLNAWQETYKYDSNQVFPLFSLDKVATIEEKIRQYCEARKLRYAFTLFSGASRLAPFVRYSVVACYLIGDRDELQRELNLKPVDSGANVLLFLPYDEGVFHGLQEVQGYQIVNTVQLYLDLYSYGGRGREQAEFLREKLIGF